MIKEECYRKMIVTVRPEENDIFLNVNICSRRKGKVVKQSRSIFFIHFYTLKEETFKYRVLKSNKKIYSLRLMKYIMETINEKSIKLTK